MRFPVVATTIAAVLAVPLAGAALSPRMSGEEFVSAARCTAYELVLAPQHDLGAERLRLNAEARRQPVETVALAHNQVNEIERRAAVVANSSDAAMMRSEQAAACFAAPLVMGAGGDDAA